MEDKGESLKSSLDPALYNQVEAQNFPSAQNGRKELGFALK